MAHAGGYECTCEHKCTEDCINPDCELCKIDHTLCCGDEETEDPEAPAEEAPETEEEPEEEWGPLTPDGNMTLVDDYGAPSQAGKQFITVVTKAGNYFYIIIDRDDNGTETVHFLNMVDEADLLALMDEDAVNDYIAQKEAKETEPTVTEEPTPTEEPEAEEEPEEPVKKKSSGALVIVLILALGGAGGYFYFTKVKNKKPKVDNGPDPDADYNEDEDDYLLDGLADEVDDIISEDEKAEEPEIIDLDDEEPNDEEEDEE
ncbi:MAG: DUF4366 domain-containing protein [Firmicutes bacterium]|nr:DUF4366 domain-containing protein [Bacillota bacterium]